MRRGERYYPLVLPDGQAVIEAVSVTTVLGMFRNYDVEDWRERVGDDYADAKSAEGRSFGTAYHRWTAHCDLNCPGAVFKGIASAADPSKADPILTAAVNGYSLWYTKHVDRIYGVEVSLVSQVYQFGGTIDLLCHMQGDPEDMVTLVDRKAANQVYSEYGLQLGGYAVLFLEFCKTYGLWGGTPKLRLLVMRADKDRPGLTQVKAPKGTAPQLRQRFLSALDLWRYLYGKVVKR